MVSYRPVSLFVVLDGVDAIDWQSLDGPYGPTPDVPRILRAVASDDREAADQAFEIVRDSISEQGSIYQVTTACVPYLVELAQIARFNRAELIWRAGYVADGQRTGGPEHFNIRAALARSVAGIVTLLGDDDADVRANAVYTFVQCGDACPDDALWDRWAVETDLSVRANLLLGLGERVPRAAAEVLATSLLEGSPEERLAAAVAIARSRLDWPAGSVDVVAQLVIDGVELSHRWMRDRGVDEVVEWTPNDSFVADTIATVFRTAPPDQSAGRPPAPFAAPVGAESATYMLDHRSLVSRRAPRQLVHLLGPMLRGRDSRLRKRALWSLSDLGSAAMEMADILITIATRPDPTDDTRITTDIRAAHTLIKLGHPAWVDILCAHWAAGREVILDHFRWRMYQPAGPDLIAEIARRLTIDANPLVVAKLASFAAETGPAAGDLEPALRAAQPLAPDSVLEALICIGRATDADLHAAVDTRCRYRHADFYAAIELCRRTGDTDALADAIERRRDLNHFMFRDVLPVAHHFTGRTGLLRSYLPRTGEDVSEMHIYAGHALLRAGEPGPAASIVRAGLADRWARGAAAQLAHELGDTGLEPDLRKALDGEDGIYAAEALVGLGARPEEFIGVLRRWLHRSWSVDSSAIEARCRALACPATTALINELADRDQRVIRGGSLGLIIWEDELMQRTLNEIRLNAR